MRKTRVAILGGGVGSLATAFELTELDEVDDLDIHVYQMGWRLGGKCASSRNAEMRWRNEEHGLHVLGGFYHNTFHMLYRLYEAWHALDPGEERKIENAFIPLNGATLFDKSPRLFGGFGPWRKIFVEFPEPPAGARPGVDPPVVDPERIVSEFFRWARQFARAAGSWVGQLDDWLLPSGLRGKGNQADVLEARLDELDQAYCDCVDKKGYAHRDDSLFSLADEFLSDIGELIERFTDPDDDTDGGDRELKPKNPGVHGEAIDLLIMLEEALVIAKGLAFDLVPLRGFDSINDEETKDWLKRHGASKRVLNSIFIEFGYHYAFSYIDGDPNKPSIAAGATMRTFARMLLTYEGHFFRHFNGGIGEVLITPFYDVLKARGVTFHFFNQVMALKPKADGTAIDKIVLRRQAMPTDPDGYDPIDQRQRIRAWPHKPKEAAIERAPWQSHFPKDFEDPADIAPGEKFYELEADTDFDIAILGIPATALHEICAPLAEQDESWAQMLDASASCPTLAAQFWTRRTAQELGWTEGRPITTGHVLPLSTWCDMSHHLHTEEQPQPYKCLSLMCGPSPTMPTDAADAAVKEWIDRNILDVLPDFGGPVDDQPDIEWYTRINNKPSDLYNFAPAGSVKYRKRTDESGYNNLFLTGDWIKNNSDLGWVEGAVMSGRQCARAVTGVHVRIFGESDFG